MNASACVADGARPQTSARACSTSSAARELRRHVWHRRISIPPAASAACQSELPRPPGSRAAAHRRLLHARRKACFTTRADGCKCDRRKPPARSGGRIPEDAQPGAPLPRPLQSSLLKRCGSRRQQQERARGCCLACRGSAAVGARDALASAGLLAAALPGGPLFASLTRSRCVPRRRSRRRRVREAEAPRGRATWSRRLIRPPPKRSCLLLRRLRPAPMERLLRRRRRAAASARAAGRQLTRCEGALPPPAAQPPARVAASVRLRCGRALASPRSARDTASLALASRGLRPARAVRQAAAALCAAPPRFWPRRVV